MQPDYEDDFMNVECQECGEVSAIDEWGQLGSGQEMRCPHGGEPLPEE